MAHVKESTHWYNQNGEPAYTVLGKNGEERATTLRDAKKLNLVPSVTTILAEANKPALNGWKENQVLMSALTLSLIAGETESEWIARIKLDAKEHAKNAALKGTEVHAWIQGDFEGRFNLPLEAYGYGVIARNEVLDKTGVSAKNWFCEKSFCKDGYGGKVDLHTPQYVIDIKTKDSDLKDIKTYNEHAMQLAAYRNGLGFPSAHCGILFISTLDKSARLVMVEEGDLIKGSKMFVALKNYWYAKSGLEVDINAQKKGDKIEKAQKRTA